MLPANRRRCANGVGAALDVFVSAPYRRDRVSLPIPTSSDPDALEALCIAARQPQEAGDVAKLADALASSGARIPWPGSMMIADVASTGGPGSLSTLFCPFLLCAAGAHVVKLAVVGRPAGAIDTLGTLPGYRTNLTEDEVRESVGASGYAHFLADRRFAPLDAALFEYRKSSGALALPPLVAASLLSKKLAVGVRAAGLDIRVGSHGNFGATVEEAKENAKLFCAAGRILGIECVGFVSASTPPSQRWIGRGEGLVALRRAVFGESDDDWLEDHMCDCQRMASETYRPTQVGERSAEKILEEHLVAQGTTKDAFLERATEVANANRVSIFAAGAGRAVFDLTKIRSVLVEAQGRAKPIRGSRFSDPAGVVLYVRPGSRVGAGEALAGVRIEDSSDQVEIVDALRSAIRTETSADDGPPTVSLAMEVVRA
jgi:thymidine phosphorylase